MAKGKKKGIPFLLYLLLCMILVGASAAGAAYIYCREKYSGDHRLYSEQAFRSLAEGSLEYRIARQFFSEEDIQRIRSADTVDNAVPFSRTVMDEDEKDPNGDGIWIEHIYAPTYEGYMMVVEDPSKVFIAVNPRMGSAGPAPELEDYVSLYHAAGGINGGGFEDSGGTGDGSIPAGIVIMNGELISGGAPQPIVGITRDHRLITTTCSGQEALDMGVYEAVTFGPTFITDGRVTYVPGTDNLNMLNPRTAIGQKADGTFLLLVIDGRGPSSFGAKYEDVVAIFQEYEAVNAGNLDGGNSSVMMYDGAYVHYPVSMYDSRNLPSVILVKGDEDE
ncbi:MAG: phosphodiester glycosidase family protein [Solobacterium sp.]|nr:phosphodiester glycosidase family protein [Solobacterium sp.]MBQ1447013.1 phosphodiester glycosidase family protein [Solobacterium sp.]